MLESADDVGGDGMRADIWEREIEAVVPLSNRIVYDGSWMPSDDGENWCEGMEYP